MQGNQNPRNSPPALPPPDQGSIGYKYGLQSSETWLPNENDSRQICDARLAVHMWRVSVFTSQHMAINLVYGSSRGRDVKSLRGPLVFYAAGQVTVYAVPTPTGGGQLIGGYAYCTLTAVNSAQRCEARLYRTGLGPLPDDAMRFVALSASTVLIDGDPVALTIGQSIPLIAGSSLSAGSGFLEFES